MSNTSVNADATAEIATLRAQLKDANDNGNILAEQMGKKNDEIKELQEKLKECKAKSKKYKEDMIKYRTESELQKEQIAELKTEHVEAVDKLDKKHEDYVDKLKKDFKEFYGKLDTDKQQSLQQFATLTGTVFRDLIAGDVQKNKDNSDARTEQLRIEAAEKTKRNETKHQTKAINSAVGSGSTIVMSPTSSSLDERLKKAGPKTTVPPVVLKKLGDGTLWSRLSDTGRELIQNYADSLGIKLSTPLSDSDIENFIKDIGQSRNLFFP